MPDQISTDAADGVLTITLDRPDQLNAFTGVMLRELLDAFDRADSDDDVRVVVVTGRGRAFCAGADVSSGGDTFDPAAHGGPTGPSSTGTAAGWWPFASTPPPSRSSRPSTVPPSVWA
jgi:enoyl-CoA hydratase/carnithine racemase